MRIGFDSSYGIVLPDEMAWIKPEYSVSQVKRAGMIYIDPASSVEDKAQALLIINNWRAAHQFPLNIITDRLRRKARNFEPRGLVAQRIKRLPAIEAKMTRETTKLNQMHDIGGCRAILHNVGHIKELVRSYKKRNVELKEYDYLEQPRTSGYRGVHLIHKYCSRQYPDFNDLKIEMQIRTQKQHLWATAVETVGFFIDQPLKAHKGDEDWLRFFTLMSSAIALQENCPVVKNTPSDKKALISELAHYVNKIKVFDCLVMYGRAVDITMENPSANHSHFLIELNTNEQRMKITGFKSDKVNIAQEKYQEAEANKKDGINVVMASAGSFAALKKAYPNYFLDTKKFSELLSKTLKG